MAALAPVALIPDALDLLGLEGHKSPVPLAAGDFPAGVGDAVIALARQLRICPGLGSLPAVLQIAPVSEGLVDLLPAVGLGRPGCRSPGDLQELLGCVAPGHVKGVLDGHIDGVDTRRAGLFHDAGGVDIVALQHAAATGGVVYPPAEHIAPLPIYARVPVHRFFGPAPGGELVDPPLDSQQALVYPGLRVGLYISIPLLVCRVLGLPRLSDLGVLGL